MVPLTSGCGARDAGTACVCGENVRLSPRREAPIIHVRWREAQLRYALPNVVRFGSGREVLVEREEVVRVMEDLVTARLKLQRAVDEMCDRPLDGPVNTYESLLVAAEACLFRALFNMKEAYRLWPQVRQAAATRENAYRVAESLVLTTETKTRNPTSERLRRHGGS